MASTRLAVLLALPSLIVGLSAPCLAQTAPGKTTAPEPFQLSARVNSNSQLSRSEIGQAGLGMNAPMESAQAPQPAPQAPLRGQALIAAAAPRTAPRAPQQDDTPGAFMNEYNVDWSHWVSSEADRWFYILRSAESGLGVRFDCPRAALVQFTCYADGSIGNVILRQSSGVPAYDQLQIEALRATMPKAPFPPGTVRSSITLVQGWESHRKKAGEMDFQPGSFGRNFPAEVVRQWSRGR